MKCAIAFLLLASCSYSDDMPRRPALEDISTPTPFFIDGNIIPRITCPAARAMGSGVVIASDRVLTAAHVIRDEAGPRQCTVEGMAATVSRIDGDFAELKLDASTPFRGILSCDGFKEGGDYFAAGYALNLPRITIQALIGSRTKAGRLTITRGSVTPGMSGGPIFDTHGRVVGIVNAYSEKGLARAYGTALKDTFICEAGNG